MSNQDNSLPQEPAKNAPQNAEPKPRRRRGFFSLLISHLMVAAMAVIAVSAYMHWSDILKYTGSKVCSYDMLGQYASEPAKVPPIDLKKPATGQSAEKNQQQPSAEEKPQADTSDATKPKPDNEALTKAWEAARKLFWNKENDAALAAYEKLVQEHPENAELRVELGNVLYKNGNTNKAAEEYFEAGKKFHQQNNTSQVDEIKKILGKIAPEKAKSLSSILNKTVQ